MYNFIEYGFVKNQLNSKLVFGKILEKVKSDIRFRNPGINTNPNTRLNSPTREIVNSTTFEGANLSHEIVDFLQPFYPFCSTPNFSLSNKNHHTLIHWRFITKKPPQGQLVRQDYIIDPCWRETAYLRRGDAKKWSSPYANYIFSECEPVLILESEKYQDFYRNLYLRRLSDPYHRDDILDNFSGLITAYLREEKRRTRWMDHAVDSAIF